MPATSQLSRERIQELLVGCISTVRLIVLHKPHPKPPNALFWFVILVILAGGGLALTPQRCLASSSFERIPIKAVALSQLSAFVKPLVIMSAHRS